MKYSQIFIVCALVPLEALKTPLPLQWQCREALELPSFLANESHAQQGEEMFLLNNLFCDKCHERRNYVELGALNGEKYANTLLLESKFNWGGLLIEGHPVNAKNLVARRGGSGTNVIFSEAVCAEHGFVDFTGPPNMGTAGVKDDMDAEYKSHWKKRLDKAQTYKVPCRPISEMIQKAGLKEIHAFFLDVEGAEMRVLDTFDWKVPVYVWIIEIDQHAEEIRKKMLEHFYVEVEPIGGNGVFLHPDLASSKAKRTQDCAAINKKK